jgi:hypothetical protein
MLELTGNPLCAARQTGTKLEMIEKHDAAVRVLVDEIDERIAERHQPAARVRPAFAPGPCR